MKRFISFFAVALSLMFILTMTSTMTADPPGQSAGIELSSLDLPAEIAGIETATPIGGIVGKMSFVGETFSIQKIKVISSHPQNKDYVVYSGQLKPPGWSLAIGTSESKIEPGIIFVKDYGTHSKEIGIFPAG